VAAAYGDALGWPNESRGKLALKKSKSDPSPDFVSWTRRDGYRATLHTEIIEPGTYSDDTQLMVAIARSLITSGDDGWWRRLTRVELPFWRLYQRGGGGATLRAAKAWAEGKSPWQAGFKEYVEAGGNGVAMRILPHVIWHHGDGYARVHRNIILDGLATHGHPRALMGAALFGYVLWSLFGRSDSLDFGQMVQTALQGIEEWSASPEVHTSTVKEWAPSTWIPASGYKDGWAATRLETIELLHIVGKAMEEGALFVDRTTLERLGALGPQRGSGTISAVSAIFLASRYAADPTHGVLEAAFAMGADTDTLACMTATLLSTVREGSQLAYRAQKVQDRDFLGNIGSTLANKGTLVPAAVAKSDVITASIASDWLGELVRRKKYDAVRLLDGRSGKIIGHATRHERDVEITEVKVEASDGQTLRFKHSEKHRVVRPNTMFPDLPTESPVESTRSYRNETPPHAFAVEVVLRCRDLETTVRFYEGAFNLRIHDDRRHRAPAVNAQVRFEGHLTFLQARNEAEVKAQAGAEIRLRTRQTTALAEQIARAGAQVKIEERDGISVLTAKDPDGRTVTVFTVR